MKLGAKIFGALAGLLILYLLLGILLPGAWVARTEARLPASPETVFPYLNRPELWIRWNSVPETGLEMVGGAAGEGAGFRWDDPQYGSGRFVIRQARPHRLLQYEVLIEGGSLRVTGTLELAPDGNGCTLRWTEEGDFGWNPILGYAARGMAESQAQAMNASLETLRRLLEEVKS